VSVCAVNGGATCQGSTRATTNFSRVVTTDGDDLLLCGDEAHLPPAAGLQMAVAADLGDGVDVAGVLARNSGCNAANNNAPNLCA
jgi:hypothetical protein